MSGGEQICERTDLPTVMCSHCRGLDERPRYTVRGGTILAQYAGELACGHHAVPGDLIGFAPDLGGWICSRCIAAAPVLS